jgi:hypothetical protein
MIVAHHGAEPALLAALVTSVGVVPLLLAAGRFRLGQIVNRLRWRP